MSHGDPASVVILVHSSGTSWKNKYKQARFTQLNVIDIISGQVWFQTFVECPQSNRTLDIMGS